MQRGRNLAGSRASGIAPRLIGPEVRIPGHERAALVHPDGLRQADLADDRLDAVDALVAVENGVDDVVLGDAHRRTHRLDYVGGRAVVLAAVAWTPVLRMRVTALLLGSGWVAAPFAPDF